ncbi:MAG: helix-turn-helix domain-containing protein [Planctomycetes bacterium]|nr:helix-turn-helix domain-containing protein [Planctomycetota bacterium]
MHSTTKVREVPETEALSAPQAAALLGISQRTLFAHAATLPASIRIGKSRRWLRSELMAWLQKRAERDAPPAGRAS